MDCRGTKNLKVGRQIPNFHQSFQQLIFTCFLEAFSSTKAPGIPSVAELHVGTSPVSSASGSMDYDETVYHLQNALGIDAYQIENDIPAKEEPDDTTENPKQEDADTEPSEEQQAGDQPENDDEEAPDLETRSKSPRRSRRRSRRHRSRSRSRRRRARSGSSESASWRRNLIHA